MSAAEQTPSGAEHAGPSADPPPGAGGISGAQRGVVAVAAVLIACAVALHMAATFFHVAPPNAVRDAHHSAIRGYLYPEFRQAWNLFAPELPANDSRVHARAAVRMPDGSTQVTAWTDITAPDIGELRGSLVPSRDRHQLRKGWSDVRRYQDSEGNPLGSQGTDARAMVTRIALERLALPDGAEAEQIQFRTETEPIPPPPWQEPAETQVGHVEADWWPLAPLTGGPEMGTAWGGGR